MKKVLLQLDTDEHPSPFDAIVATTPASTSCCPMAASSPMPSRALVQDAFFTRGIDDLQTSAVWVGGKRVATGEEVFAEVQKAFFGPFRVSVMLDSNGCNTTAATTVARIAKARSLSGGRAAVLGLGAVGLRSAVLLRQEGCEVTLAALPADLFGDDRPYHRPHGLEVAQRLGFDVREPADRGELEALVDGAQIVLSAGPAGVRGAAARLLGSARRDRAAGRLQRGRAAGPRGHERHRRPRRLRRQARARRAGHRRAEDEGPQGVRAAAVRAQRPGARHRRASTRSPRSSCEPRVRASPASIPARSRSTCARSTAARSCSSAASPPRDVGADPAPLVDALCAARAVRARARPGRLRAAARPRRSRSASASSRSWCCCARTSRTAASASAGCARSCARSSRRDCPLVFGPGAIHLPTIPAYRKWNRIDLGTADKVASAALCIADQARRLGIDFAETLVRDARARRRRSAPRWPSTAGGSSTGSAARPARSARGRAVRWTRRWRTSSAPRCRSGPCSAAARSTRKERSTSRAAGGAAARPAPPRRLARAGGGRGQGRARADGERAGPARDPRRGPPGAGAGHARRARRAARARGAGAVRRDSAATDRRAGRGACSPTAWRAAATRRSSSAWAVRDARGSALDHLRIHGADRIRLR